uniref:Mevalonate kinase n=1 Tax=Candidatus Methanogaster sp. ANME-2c ERB4 TaxID=2759911 RepID=A0A7G9YMF2_9EURY|nr:hypothetical protein CDCKMDEO_00031 [Methanosarcinales archaeon ANME-2c ERB4]
MTPTRSAPGKPHLFGEHAVVHAAEAIASTTNIHPTATVAEANRTDQVNNNGNHNDGNKNIRTIHRSRPRHLLPDESDLNEIEWLQAAAGNPAFDFLKDPEEDIYTLADGDRFVNRSIKPQHTDQVKANENHNNRSKTNAQTA